MKTNRLVVLTLLFLSMNLFSQDPNFHIYLAFGQSNMEGSAEIEAQDKIGDERFKVLQSLDCSNLGFTKNEWRVATPPLTQCYTGLSPADYFGKTMIKYLPKEVQVGIINVAVGGSDIRLFDKENYKNYTKTYPEEWFQKKIVDYGGNPYEHFIKLARKAQKKGVIKGIILHQGETNQDDKNWPKYVKKVYYNMLADLSLDANKVPLIASELVGKEQNGICASMNPIINTLPNVISTAHVVSSKGCKPRKDNVHFNSAGVRELGKRYALKMLSIKGYKVKDYNPNKDLKSVEVLPNNKVAFRIYAPNATTVKLYSDDKWDFVAFKKDKDGVWEGFWNDVKPGVYSYKFIVDGVEVQDSKAVSITNNMPVIKIATDKDFFYKRNTISHGAISIQNYYSKTIQKNRRLRVWSPPGYEKSKKKLPVLYLIHGGGGSETSWSNIGAVGDILDNLFSDGKIKPMLVVMPNGTIETAQILDRVPLFTKDLMNDIIPFIEKTYKVKTNQNDRAIMGLSMGGLETLEAVTFHPNKFGYVGVLSSGWWLSNSWKEKRGIVDNSENRLKQLNLIAPDFNKSVKMLHFTQGGPEDIAFENGNETLKLFKKAKINFTYSEMSGGHTWMVWRKNLRDLAPKLFK